MPSAPKPQLPAPPQKCKKRPQCEVTKERSEFALTQWGLPCGICLQRRPVGERLQQRAKPKKVCCERKVECPREAFSNSQWDAEAASACSACVAVSALALQKRARAWKTCGEEKVKEELSETQCHEGGRASTSFRCRAFSQAWPLPLARGSHRRYRCQAQDQSSKSDQNGLTDENSPSCLPRTTTCRTWVGGMLWWLLSAMLIIAG